MIECFLDYSYDQSITLIFEFDLCYNINMNGPPQKGGFHLRHPVGFRFLRNRIKTFMNSCTESMLKKEDKEDLVFINFVLNLHIKCIFAIYLFGTFY